MKVHVLRGRRGEVIATFERTPNALVSVEPEVEEGCSLEEVEAPDDYAHDLKSFYKKCEESARKR